ncbi:MAG: serine/threonine protein kinase, partial [Actinomycetota bacterium]|nr:serine/threonine protein kinase [Actinomycetota bacterium]
MADQGLREPGHRVRRVDVDGQVERHLTLVVRHDNLEQQLHEPTVVSAGVPRPRSAGVVPPILAAVERTGRGDGGRTTSTGRLSRLLRRRRPGPEHVGAEAATHQAGFSLGIPGYQDPVLLGQGGFGSVYTARQVAFERTVAIKVLSAPGLDADLRRRFQRECQALGKLSGHPNIVTVYDSGFTDMGRAYIAMSYNAGGSLAARTKSQGPMAWEEAVEIGVKLAGALETAHRAGILHRDIKPENVLVSAYGEPQLADFGSAAIHEGTGLPSAVITATLPHAAPEVLGDRPASRATDVYSLASTIFTLMAGRPAFAPKPDEDIHAVLARIVSDPLPDLRPRGVPDGVCRVLERAMAKQPTARHSSAVDFGSALQGAQE